VESCECAHVDSDICARNLLRDEAIALLRVTSSSDIVSKDRYRASITGIEAHISSAYEFDLA